MRCNGFVFPLALAAAMIGAATPNFAASFGSVVPIGGHASDIVLDESRGQLYVANFTANRIEVMSTSDNTVRTSLNVSPQPGALSLSPDNTFLLVAHFGNITPSDPTRNAITLINLNDNTRQTFTIGDTPLGVAFVADGTALIITTTSLIQFDPVSGAMNVLATFASLATQLPATPGTFPTQVILASLTTNPSRTVAYALTDDNNYQGFIRYDAVQHRVWATGIFCSPKPLPRVSVAADGSWALMGFYKLDGTAHFLSQFPLATTSTNIGGNVVDSKAGIIYAQILTQAPSSTTPANSSSTPAASAPTAQPPVLSILAADNLTVQDNLSIPENITGRMVLTAAGDVIYAVSDSGVSVYPIGRLKQYHRLAAAQSDLVAAGNFCDRNVIVQSLTITDPGGGNTDFTVSTTQTGVSISPASGLTPATVQVRVDPNAFQNQNGTVAVSLTLTSATAVNVPPPVRLLINNRNPDQRGTSVDVPGTLTDILADPVRNRFYIVQQDKNQVLVFDGSTYTQIATLRTATTPTRLATTFDRQYLLIGHDNSQLAFVYNLDTFEQQPPIFFPSGHYPRSIAESGKSLLGLVRDVAGDAPGAVDRIDFAGHQATELPSLGIYKNSVSADAALAPAPNGGAILLAAPDGNVMLYDANADTFTVSRKDTTKLQGPFAASSYNTYVVGDNLLNASLVPQATLETASGASAGFTFIDQWGFRATSSALTSPGVIQRVDPTVSMGIKPTRMVESTLEPSAVQPMIRTLAPMSDRSAVIALTVSGFTVLPWNYDAAVAPPTITKVVNLADGTQPVAEGGLISVMGNQMSPVNLATKQIPLPTALGESCLTVNGIPVPMLFVSTQQINGQLPYITGNVVMSLHTPGGISNNFNLSINLAAPSVFRSGTAGPMTGLATIMRADDSQLVTPTNPIHPNDQIVIYATGLGATLPAVDAGLPAPADPLPAAVITPDVSLGGVPLAVSYAGLVPGEVGVYQINASVPLKVPQGLDIPLVVSQAGMGTIISVRVVN